MLDEKTGGENKAEGLVLMRGNYKVGSVKSKKIRLFDFSKGMSGEVDERLAAPASALVSYNFALFDGALKDGVGVGNLRFSVNDGYVTPKLPSGASPEKIYYYKRFNEADGSVDDRIMVFCSDSCIYQWSVASSSDVMSKIDGLYFGKAPFGVNYRLNNEDCYLLSSEGAMFVYNGSEVSLFEAPEITSMCVHNERLFITVEDAKTQLWFSKTFDPTNWNVSLDEGGFIDFRQGQGKILKAISFGGYLYVFMNYGISRLTAYGDQREFDVDKVYLNSGRIIASSITECGKYVVYLAEDGFYRFDGGYSTRILPELNKYLKNVNNENMRALYHNGKFYACVNMRIKGKIERVIIVYDFGSKDYYVVKGVDAADMVRAEGDSFSSLLVVVKGYSQMGVLTDVSQIFSKPLNKIWQSNPSDYGVEGVKTLAKIHLYSKNEIYISFKSDYGEAKIKIPPSQNLQTFKIGLKGTVFTATITSRIPSAEISKLTLELEYVGG